MIKEKIFNEIKEYCKYNNIDDVEKEINKILLIGFNVVRYGVSPFKKYEENEQNIEREVIKDKTLTNKEKKIDTLTEINNDVIESKKESEVKKKVRIIKNK